MIGKTLSGLFRIFISFNTLQCILDADKNDKIRKNNNNKILNTNNQTSK